MALLDKQFEFQISGRGLVIDHDLEVTSDNLQYILDVFELNGVSVVDLDAEQVTALTDAVSTIIETFKEIS